MSKETLDDVVRALRAELEEKDCGRLRIIKCPYRLAGKKQPVAFSRILQEAPFGLSIIEVFRKGSSFFWRKPISVCNDRKRAKKIAIDFLTAKGIKEQDVIYQTSYGKEG